MADKAQTTKTPVTTLSREFVLRERLKKLDVWQDEPHRADPDPVAAVSVLDVWAPVANRWVYVFQALGSDVTWIAEYWVDAKGAYYPADMKDCTDKTGKPAKERQDRQPLKAMLGARNRHEKLAFHHTINGKRAYHAFYLSGVRMSLNSLRKLATSDYFQRLVPTDLSVDAAYRLPIQLTLHKGEKGEDWVREDPTLPDWPYGELGDIPSDLRNNLYVSVFDVFFHGMSLNRVVQQLRDLELAWLIPAADLDKDQRKRTEQRQKKRLLAGILKPVADANSDVMYALRHGDLDQWLDHYEQVRKKHQDDVRTWAKKLTEWMDLKITTFTVDGILSLENVDPNNCEDDLVWFMTVYSACMDRMIETGPGLDWLNGIVADKSHFIHRWVLDTSSSPRLYAKVFDKTPKAFFWMFKEVFVPYRQKYGLAFRATMVNPLYGTIAARDITVDLQPEQWVKEDTGHVVTVTKDADIRVYIKEGPLPREVGDPGNFGGQSADETNTAVVPKDAQTGGGGSQAPGVEDIKQNAAQQQACIAQWEAENSVRTVENQTVTTDRRPTNWSKNIRQESVDRILKAQEAFGHAMAALNMALALYDLADKGVNTKTLLNAGASLGKLVPSLNALLELNLSKRSLQGIGFVTAVYDCWSYTSTGLKARDSGNTTAAGGYLLTGFGSGMIALGTGLAIIGVETSWTGVGTVLVAVGLVIALVGGSAPIESFAQHCVWGQSYGADGGDAGWQEGPFSGWHEKNPDGLDRQLKAMFNLAAGFSVQASDFSEALITLGMTQPNSKLYVKFDAEFGTRRVQRAPTLIVNLDTRTLAQDQKLTHDPANEPNWANLDECRLALYQNKDGRVAVRVKLRYLPRDLSVYEDAGQMVNCDCAVRLDLNGDGKSWIPSSGAWVPCHIKAIGEMLNKDVAVSIDH